jgi:hypothetical protein
MPQCKLQNTTLTQHGKKPRDDEPWNSLLFFTTPNKLVEDDDEPFGSLSSFTMQEKKVENDDEVHSSLSSTLVS